MDNHKSPLGSDSDHTQKILTILIERPYGRSINVYRFCDIIVALTKRQQCAMIQLNQGNFQK